jgi:hypothetical protein
MTNRPLQIFLCLSSLLDPGDQVGCLDSQCIPDPQGLVDDLRCGSPCSICDKMLVMSDMAMKIAIWRRRCQKTPLAKRGVVHNRLASDFHKTLE